MIFLSSVDFFSFFNTVIQKYHRVDANQVRHMVEHDLVDDTINIQITQKVNHLQNATLKGQCHKYLFCPPVITFVVYWQPKQTVGIQALRLKKNFVSCSTQLSIKFQLLVKTKIPTNEDVSCFKSLRCCIYHANKC